MRKTGSASTSDAVWPGLRLLPGQRAVAGGRASTITALPLGVMMRELAEDLAHLVAPESGEPR